MTADKTQRLKSLLNGEGLLQPKALLIEDSQFDVVYIKKIIEVQFPFTLIDNAESKKQAIEHLKNSRYDVILLDLHLPDNDGPNIIKDIKEHSAKTPTILVSAHTDNKTIERALQLGAEDVINKRDLLSETFTNTMEANLKIAIGFEDKEENITPGTLSA